MALLILQAYIRLVLFDVYLARNDFAGLYAKVRDFPVSGNSFRAEGTETICAAVDLACIWYWKEALCLQRSAATVCLLRRRGIPAQLVIGTQKLPFKAHAWVEVDGCVVNDKPYTPEMYLVLDRC
jgi:hypothetical protein